MTKGLITRSPQCKPKSNFVSVAMCLLVMCPYSHDLSMMSLHAYNSISRLQ